MLLETFGQLARDPAHWQFELLLIFIFDVLIGAVVWPFIKRRISKEHAHEKKLEARVWMLEHPLQEAQEEEPRNTARFCHSCRGPGYHLKGCPFLAVLIEREAFERVHEVVIVR